MLDIFISCLALLFSSPVLLIIAILLLSKESIIFKQKRVGLNGKVFTIYKFRTMKSGAHKLQKKYKSLNISPFPTFKIPNDPRLSSIGLFLSKTTLDELPQLVNVLKGDMSIVGPRPFPEKEHNLLTKKWRQRSLVKPGLISQSFFYPRSKMTTSQWTKIDLNYAQDTSFLKDFNIMSEGLCQYIRIFFYQVQKLTTKKKSPGL